jgi:hypothetical protein
MCDFPFSGQQVETHAAVLLFATSNRRGEAAGHFSEIRRGHAGQDDELGCAVRNGVALEPPRCNLQMPGGTDSGTHCI